MLRVVAGRYGGRRLATPPGLLTRPTSDRVREALFSTLTTLTELEGCRFVDLFAGSGAVGLEAASRGAAEVLLVESDSRAAGVVRSNIATLGAGPVCRVQVARVASVLAVIPAEPYDVVFADPPYAVDDDAIAELLVQLAAGWLAPDAVVVVEREARSPEPRWPEDVTPQRGRRYGESTLWYGRRA